MGEQPLLPGGTGFSRLRVYPWDTDDGLHGGSPHLHLTCTECYLVLGGTGELHTLTLDGLRVIPLRAGDAVWFTPGTVHRAVNTGELRVQVIMQNDGLPEAGDAVMTFPDSHLASPSAYAAAADLGAGSPAERQQRARRRRDLAIAGFTELVAGGAAALERFYAAAVALVADRMDAWERAWRARALAAALRTGEQIEALRRGDGTHLRQARVARLDAPAETALGMCGFLAPYARDAAETPPVSQRGPAVE
ncbi:cupin domain-containing protein [Goodfellowiella coeruleoviolacea]|uniref:Cupin domain-containing protein n=1 Tax=Goodfellowiella coeruleoviolacea TaxID=334858 RepID=A0AAE3KHS0_9PSEU|nr:cupin domain-containing protein [Goodfellowiella coeruleoviolacea]MCP2168546.1 Cupin domain-containing protein [Goodfellowiella coeruleoviolacea]